MTQKTNRFSDNIFESILKKRKLNNGNCLNIPEGDNTNILKNCPNVAEGDNTNILKNGWNVAEEDNTNILNTHLSSKGRNLETIIEPMSMSNQEKKELANHIATPVITKQIMKKQKKKKYGSNK